jgi:hypothetical protein
MIRAEVLVAVVVVGRVVAILKGQAQMVVEMVALQGLRVGLVEQQLVAVAVAVAVKETETVAQVVPAYS